VGGRKEGEEKEKEADLSGLSNFWQHDSSARKGRRKGGDFLIFRLREVARPNAQNNAKPRRSIVRGKGREKRGEEGRSSRPYSLN